MRQHFLPRDDDVSVSVGVAKAVSLSVCLCSNLECVNLLLNIGADFNRKDNFGRFVVLFFYSR